MKKILLSLTLVVSLIFGSTFAVADTSTNSQTIQTMSAGKDDGKKGLDEAMVVGNGQEIWVLHQPVERYPVYFNSTSDEKMVGESSEDQNRQQS